MDDFYGRDLLRDISAGTLGFIHGNVGGAIAGIKIARNIDSTYRNYMKRKADSNGSSNKRAKIVGKTRYKRRGSFKKTSIPRKRCGRKPAGLNANQKRIVARIANKTLHAEVPAGKYLRNMLLNMPQVLGTPTTPVQNVVNELLLNATTGEPTARLSVGTFYDVMDSVSVLWGTKTAGLYNTVGQLDPVQLVIPNYLEKAQATIVNDTTIDQHFLIYEITPKEDTTTTVFQNWSNMSATTPQKGGTNRAITYYGMRPEMYPRFTEQYKILKKSTYTLKPGKSIKYVMQASANHVRLDEWLQVNSTTHVTHRKGFTKELLVINTNLVFGPTTAATSLGGAWSVAGTDTWGVGVEWKKIYSNKCPERFDSEDKDNTFCVWSLGMDQPNNGGQYIQAPSYTVAAINT